MKNGFVNMTRNITLKIQLKFCGTFRSQGRVSKSCRCTLWSICV